MISVAIAYYNRRQHLINTLWSMTKSVVENFEVIVVDDGSDDEHRIDDLEKIFKFLKVIRINKVDKKHINPCIPFNIAISHTIGEIIILQNPECFHYSDIFQYAVNNIKRNKYLVYSVVDKDLVNNLSKIDWKNNYSFEINEIINIQTNNRKTNNWYTHSIFRPVALNFCTTITRGDLRELNGFDERYKDGIAKDDLEFLARIKRKKMDIIFVDEVIAIHQSHKPFNYLNQKNLGNLININNKLYSDVTMNENEVLANPNKKILKK